jgi:hypothetical protein
MDTEAQTRTRAAVLARDAAHVRLRRFTGGAVGVAVGLSAVFAALAANATHAKKTIVRNPSGRASRQWHPLTVAPAAPLVSVQAGAPPAAQAPQATAPTPSYAPPVVSSGGS